jgi:hypothetical protein
MDENCGREQKKRINLVFFIRDEEKMKEKKIIRSI